MEYKAPKIVLKIAKELALGDEFRIADVPVYVYKLGFPRSNGRGTHRLVVVHVGIIGADENEPHKMILTCPRTFKILTYDYSSTERR